VSELCLAKDAGRFAYVAKKPAFTGMLLWPTAATQYVRKRDSSNNGQHWFWVAGRAKSARAEAKITSDQFLCHLARCDWTCSGGYNRK
jgi:hypothetical protein